VRRVLRHVRRLWGYGVHLTETDASTGNELAVYRSENG
jgi:spore cortex formation protein SpoVR/YcgB (stage V sporulation)